VLLRKHRKSICMKRSTKWGGALGTIAFAVIAELVVQAVTSSSLLTWVWGTLSSGIVSLYRWLGSTVELPVFGLFFVVALWLASLLVAVVMTRRAMTPAPLRWPVLTANEVRVMRVLFVANNDGFNPGIGVIVTVLETNPSLNVTRVEVTLALEVLGGHSLVQRHHDYYKGSTFGLSTKGRAYAVESFVERAAS
jgi:hypothetical protein